jgi:hypothetical protein
VNTDQELVTSKAASLFRFIRRRVATLKGDIQADAHTQRVAEWVVLKLRHPMLSDMFGREVLPLSLRMVDDSNLQTKARGLRMLAHCTKHLMLPDLRFHGPLLLHRLLNAYAFHQVDIEEPLLESFLVLLPALLSDPGSLSTNKRRNVHQKNIDSFLEGIFKEVEWVGLGTSDLAIDRVRFYAEGLLPKLIHVLGDRCALYIRTIIPTLSRMGETRDLKTALGALKGLEALVHSLPTRISAHYNKLFETCARIYIKHQVEGKTKGSKDRRQVCRATCELLAKICSSQEHFRPVVHKAFKGVSALAGMKKELKTISDSLAGRKT